MRRRLASTGDPTANRTVKLTPTSPPTRPATFDSPF